MRKMQAEEFGKGWEYDKAKRQERKSERQTRERRRTGRGVWQPKPADE